MVTPRKRVSAVWEFFNEAIVVEVKDGKHVKISCKLCDQQLKWWWWHYQNLLSKHPEEHKRIVPSNTTTTKQDILKGFFPNFLLNMPLQSVTFAEFVAKDKCPLIGQSLSHWCAMWNQITRYLHVRTSPLFTTKKYEKIREELTLKLSRVL
jgi:hypothetical protein